MPKRYMRSLEEILQSTSDNLFPAELGERIVTVSSRDCDGDTPLHVLVWRSDIEGISQLIAAGADVNAIGDMGETPLHIAVSVECIEIIKLLLGADANCNIRSEFGKTPHEQAILCGGSVAQLFTGVGI